MKVFAINGRPKPNGNTATAMKTVLTEIEQQGIATELVTIGQEVVRGCIGCGTCGKQQNRQCVFDGDAVNAHLPKMIEADAILIGSPTYYSGVNGTMKAFLDRTFYVAAANGSLFRHKVGAAVVAVRRSGGIPTFDQLNKYWQISEMLSVGSSYWNVIHGMVPGEAPQDEEGMHVMQTLGQNIAWLLKLIEHGKDTVKEPQPTPKPRTNFIR